MRLPSDNSSYRDVRIGSDRAVDGCSLSSASGWNQTVADWKFMLERGCGFGFEDTHGQLIASAVTVPYAPHFSWISMVLVNEKHRRKGLAKRLMEACLGDLEKRQLIPVLDATEAGKKVYEQMGFSGTQEIARLSFAPGSIRNFPEEVSPPVGLAPIRLQELPLVAEWDEVRFSSSRKFLLEYRLRHSPSGAFKVATDSGTLKGIAFSSAGRTARHIGPIVAEDSLTAIDLLDHLQRVHDGPLLLDCPVSNQSFMAHCLRGGWVEQRRFVRMSTHPEAQDAGLKQAFATAGPEVG